MSGFGSKITRKWLELKRVVVTMYTIIRSLQSKQSSISVNVLSVLLVASLRLTISNPEFDTKKVLFTFFSPVQILQAVISLQNNVIPYNICPR